MSTSTTDPQLGRLIPRFRDKGVLIDEGDIEIEKELGKGASGTTFKALYRGEQVAYKVYDNSVLCQDFEACCNEMHIMTAIQHENIIGHRGLVLQEAPVRAGLVMELAAHGEMGDALYKTGSRAHKGLKKQGTRGKYKVALGIARGLQYLHSNNVIHRDVKPANVLLGRDYQALLADFGLSRYVDSGSAGAYTGETGSYRYMAPEVIRHGKYSFAADIYSWAIVVNELFSGERPYPYQLPVDAARGVVKDNARPSQKKIRQLTLKNLIAQAWGPDPKTRPDWDNIISHLTIAEEEYTAARAAGVGGMLLRRANKSSGAESR